MTRPSQSDNYLVLKSNRHCYKPERVLFLSALLAWQPSRGRPIKEFFSIFAHNGDLCLVEPYGSVKLSQLHVLCSKVNLQTCLRQSRNLKSLFSSTVVRWLKETLKLSGIYDVYFCKLLGKRCFYKSSSKS